MKKEDLVIGIVGPCKSGKTTLRDGLIKLGFNGKQIAQEHSFSPSMWQKLTNPDILIYLRVNYFNSKERGKLNWLERDHTEQLKRLAHARENANLIIDTNELSIQGVLDTAVHFIEENID